MKYEPVLRMVQDEGHVMGSLSAPGAHGVRSSECLGCGAIIVVWPWGKADPERRLLRMTCEESKRIRDVAKEAATPQSLTPSGQTDVGTGGTSGREGGR